MQFSAEHYFRAAYERILDARELHKRGRYGFCLYASGLAVESLLRAFRWIDDKSFDGRHDLDDLLKASGVLRVDENYMRRRGKDEEDVRDSTLAFRGAMNEVALLWHNNLRFASEARLRSHLIRINRVQGIKGDPLKKNAADLIRAAQLIVNKGIVLWNSRKK